MSYPNLTCSLAYVPDWNCYELEIVDSEDNNYGWIISEDELRLLHGPPSKILDYYHIFCIYHYGVPYDYPAQISDYSAYLCASYQQSARIETSLDQVLKI